MKTRFVSHLQAWIPSSRKMEPGQLAVAIACAEASNSGESSSHNLNVGLLYQPHLARCVPHLGKQSSDIN